MRRSLRTITPSDAINVIQSSHVYTANENLENWEGIISQENTLQVHTIFLYFIYCGNRTH
jgi:hypothetical protein